MTITPVADVAAPALSAAGRPAARRPADRRRALGLLALAVALALTAALSLAVGSQSISPGTTWRVLWHDDGSTAAVIIHRLRLPRTGLGLAVGAALGLAGALTQALTRNALADPGILGVNLGAAAAVVTAIAFLGVHTLPGYVWFAFAGAAVVSVAVFALGGGGRAASPDRLVLAGVSITAVLGAGITGVLVTRREAFDRYRHWDIGSLADRDAGTLRQVAPFLIVGVVLAVSLGRRLNALSLGDEAAVALGAHPGRIRTLAILAVTLLCGAATAAVGPLTFLGLAVPYLARLLTGPDLRWILRYCALLGPVLLLTADVAGRVLVAPAELDVGILTAVLGAPVFLALCRRRRLGQL